MNPAMEGAHARIMQALAGLTDEDAREVLTDVAIDRNFGLDHFVGGLINCVCGDEPTLTDEECLDEDGVHAGDLGATLLVTKLDPGAVQRLTGALRLLRRCNGPFMDGAGGEGS